MNIITCPGRVASPPLGQGTYQMGRRCTGGTDGWQRKKKVRF